MPSPADSAGLIPITLLTGFLGSGKTTVLNRLVRQPELAEALVVINEFGQIGLDHLLVAHSDEQAVVQMNSGCLCCTIRSDLARTLRDALWRFSRGGRRQFRRVVIEATGLADPASILHTLMSNDYLAGRYRLDGVVATVDMLAGEAALDLRAEAVKQAAMADLLLLTKPDLVAAPTEARLRRRLASLNPGARIILAPHGGVDASAVLGLGACEAFGTDARDARRAHTQAHIDGHGGAQTCADLRCDVKAHELPDLRDGVFRHDDGIRTSSLIFDQPVPRAAVESALAALLARRGANILRLKGVLNIQGEPGPLAVHGVQHVLYPMQPLPARSGPVRPSAIVLIARGAEPGVIESEFEACLRACGASPARAAGHARV